MKNYVIRWNAIYEIAVSIVRKCKQNLPPVILGTLGLTSLLITMVHASVLKLPARRVAFSTSVLANGLIKDKSSNKPLTQRYVTLFFNCLHKWFASN